MLAHVFRDQGVGVGQHLVLDSLSHGLVADEHVPLWLAGSDPLLLPRGSVLNLHYGSVLNLVG